MCVCVCANKMSVRSWACPDYILLPYIQSPTPLPVPPFTSPTLGLTLNRRRRNNNPLLIHNRGTVLEGGNLVSRAPVHQRSGVDVAQDTPIVGPRRLLDASHGGSAHGTINVLPGVGEGDSEGRHAGHNTGRNVKVLDGAPEDFVRDLGFLVGGCRYDKGQ